MGWQGVEFLREGSVRRRPRPIIPLLSPTMIRDCCLNVKEQYPGAQKKQKIQVGEPCSLSFYIHELTRKPPILTKFGAQMTGDVLSGYFSDLLDNFVRDTNVWTR